VSGGSRLSALGYRIVLRFGAVLATIFVLLALLAAGSAGAQPSAEERREASAESREPLVPVAARALARGAILGDSDITLVPTSTVRATPATAARIAERGWTTRRAIAAGELLREPAVAPPTAVTAGSTVDLLWRDGDLELRLRGVAANSAPIGGRVAVRVGRRRFEGIATAAAVVRLP
jgi:flagella basal body P-ring formation protein FlgA